MSHHRWLVNIEPNKITFEMKYHLIHKKGLHLPSHTIGLLKPEQYVQWIFWEDVFEYQEEKIPLGDKEMEERLRGFVNANTVNAPLSNIFLWYTFHTFKKVIPNSLLKKLIWIGAQYRHRLIRT